MSMLVFLARTLLQISLLRCFPPTLRPLDFIAGLLAEADALLRAEPVDRLDNIDHLGYGHFAGALAEHYDTSIEAGGHSLFLIFGSPPAR